MNKTEFVPPRLTPSQQDRYMGLAWTFASFSKDPNTQVGAVIISQYNEPLGTGYNGPPRLISDEGFSWHRPKAGDESVNRYDLVKHAESNAIKHCHGKDLSSAVLYVTALPCPKCMLEIIDQEISNVIYYDFQGDSKSSLQNGSWRDKTFEMAKMSGVKLQKFQGSVSWVADWTENLKRLGVFNVQ